MTWADTQHINANANNDNLPEVLVEERELCTGTEYHLISSFWISATSVALVSESQDVSPVVYRSTPEVMLLQEKC